MTKRNIVHIEIPSADLERSGAFYGDMFGWKITPMPEMNYALWEPDQGPGGGFSPMGADVKPGEILLHVNSDDIDADMKRAVALGAAAVRGKTEIPGIGWWAVFKDPSGNAIALFTSVNPAPDA